MVLVNGHQGQGTKWIFRGSRINRPKILLTRAFMKIKHEVFVQVSGV